MLKPILVVEDNPGDRELMLIALQRSLPENEVIAVRDGAEALDYLYRLNAFVKRDEGNPVFVLLDLSLPKVSGLEVLKAMRADEQLKNIPVAMLTSSQKDVHLAEAYDLGVNCYLVKPVALNKFVNAVAKLGMFWATLNQQPPISTGHLPADT